MFGDVQEDAGLIVWVEMDFTKIKIIGGPPVLASEAEIENAASALGITFPDGYAKYLTVLGEGALEDYIRIYPPWRILNELEEWRDRIRQYWFWDEGADVITDEQVEESVVFADTLDGDELIFHPAQPNRILVLPRHQDTIFEAGKTLPETITWICNSGQLVIPFEVHNFEPYDSRLWKRKKWTPPQRQTGVDRLAVENSEEAVALEKKPGEFLREFFVALEKWETAASEALTNYGPIADENVYFGFIDSLKDDLYTIAAPFVSDSFAIGEPQSYGIPARYGSNGPRIAEIEVLDDGAVEIVALGDNTYGWDDAKRLFRLVRRGRSWQVDGLWELTKTGRRKRIKLF